MGLLDWFSGANPAASVAQGAVTGVLSGLTDAANGVREAVTGKLSAEHQAEFDMKWQTLTQKLLEGQQSINLADANSGSNFRGGWRPAIGWVCAIALFFYFVPPIAMATLLWTIQCVSVMWNAVDISKTGLPLFPLKLDPTDVLGLVGSLLGMSMIRSYDRSKETRNRSTLG
jgi:hypothetical protein